MDQCGLKIPRITYAWYYNDKRLIKHALSQMQMSIEAIGATDIFHKTEDANHLAGTTRIGFDRETSVVNADCRSWDIPNLWVCDGSVFLTTGEVNPSLTIQAIAPHVAQHTSARRSAIDGRTTRHVGYAISQRLRKRIEEPFGWMKAAAGLRKTRHRGLARVGWIVTLTAAACNLVRLPKLLAAAT